MTTHTLIELGRVSQETKGVIGGGESLFRPLRAEG